MDEKLWVSGLSHMVGRFLQAPHFDQSPGSQFATRFLPSQALPPIISRTTAHSRPRFRAPCQPPLVGTSVTRQEERVRKV